MFEPLCFLHVADAGLDRPLRDVGPAGSAARRLADDATRIAFAQMIDGAIHRHVDFVLLAGNTFWESDRSLRARLELVAGLERLEEHGISVFVLPGRSDPISAWRAIPNLPNNVTLLAAEESDEDEPTTPVAMLRDGRVIATITPGSLAQLSGTSQPALPADESRPPSANGQARPTPFRVGLLTDWPAERSATPLAEELSDCDCDYLAVPAADRQARRSGWVFEAGATLDTRAGIAHHPGRLQAISPKETGPHGATLIEVDQAGKIRGTFLPFASVRRLEFCRSIAADATPEELAAAMQAQLNAETAQAGEQGWFVTWILKGTGAFFESLQEPDRQAAFLEALPQSPADHPDIQVEHRLRLEHSFAGQEHASSELERLFQEALKNTWADAAEPSLMEEVFADLRELDNPEWRARLICLVDDLDPQEILTSARELGHDWFGEAAGT